MHKGISPNSILVPGGQTTVENLLYNMGRRTMVLAGSFRELRKEQFGDAIDKYFRLGKNLNQRDTIAVRKMTDGYLKFLYPDGIFSKEDVAEVLKISLEMRRHVKIIEHTKDQCDLV